MPTWYLSGSTGSIHCRTVTLLQPTRRKAFNGWRCLEKRNQRHGTKIMKDSLRKLKSDMRKTLKTYADWGWNFNAIFARRLGIWERRIACPPAMVPGSFSERAQADSFNLLMMTKARAASSLRVRSAWRSLSLSCIFGEETASDSASLIASSICCSLIQCTDFPPSNGMGS